MTTTFEDRALVALKEIVTEPPRRHRGRTVAAIGAAVAALAAGGVAVAVASAPSPAFAVKSNDDGTVTVTVRSWRDAEGLQRELGKHGVPTVATYVPPRKQCVKGWYTPAERPSSQETRYVKTVGPLLVDTKGDSGAITFVINKKMLHPGETLILLPTGPSPAVPLNRDNGRAEVFLSAILDYSVATGKVGHCVLEDVTLPK